jgi:hypothetical protein
VLLELMQTGPKKKKKKISVHSLNAYRDMEAYLHSFLTVALDGHEWSVLRISHFISMDGDPGIHLTGSSVGPTAGMDGLDKRRISCTYRKCNLYPSHRCLVPILITLSPTPVFLLLINYSIKI